LGSPLTLPASPEEVCWTSCHKTTSAQPKQKESPNSTSSPKHALRPALVPAVTFLGPAFAAIITGSFVVESIFLIPGMGQYFVLGIQNQDYTLVLGLVLFYGILMGIANLMSDLALIFMDPKLRNS
jgi:oligopeptide transport system permease protein